MTTWTDKFFIIMPVTCHNCGRDKLYIMNTIILCPSCGWYEPKDRKPIEPPKPVAVKTKRVKKRKATARKTPYTPKPTPMNKSGILYQLSDGRRGIAYKEDQKLLPTKKEECVLKMVDENMEPVMSERFPEKQATTWKRIDELTLIGFVD